MSTRNQAAAAGNTAAGIRNAFTAVRNALRTQTARSWIFTLQFLLSLGTVYYFIGVVRMAYYSCFYRLEIPDDQKKSYCLLATFACIGYGLLMLFTRRQIVTRCIIMISMPFYLPIFLFNYQHLVLLIPLGIMVVVTYVASGAGEGVKTILGAVFLMIYILGTFVFFVVQSILQPAVTETVTERSVSPNEQYRYWVVQVEDQADGNTYVAVEPNTLDLAQEHCYWYAKGYSKEIYRERPLGEFEVEWQTQSRADITRTLIRNNPNTTFTLNAEQIKLLGLDADYTEEYTLGSLNRKQRLRIGYALKRDLIGDQTAESLGVTLEESDFAVILTYDQMLSLGLEPSCEKKLSALTDQDLAALGIPEQNEVLLVNGKVVFRQYVAILEGTFDESNRSLTAFMESNTLPDVVAGGIPIPEHTTTSATTTTQSTETTETTAETTE